MDKRNKNFFRSRCTQCERISRTTPIDETMLMLIRMTFGFSVCFLPFTLL